MEFHMQLLIIYKRYCTLRFYLDRFLSSVIPFYLLILLIFHYSVLFIDNIDISFSVMFIDDNVSK